MSKPVLYLFNGKVASFGNAVFGFTPAEVYSVTLDTVSHGTISASPMSGVAGTTITLSSTPDTGYELDHFTVNGVAIVGDSFTMPAENVTVGAVMEESLPFNTVRIGNQIWSDYLTSDDGGSGIYIATNPSNLVTIQGTFYYYNTSAINRIAQAYSSRGWRIPTQTDWNTLYSYAGNDIRKLKATYGWGSDSTYCGTDDFGFGLLALGYYEASISRPSDVNQYAYLYFQNGKSVGVSYDDRISTISSIGYYPPPLRLVKDA